jgi:hypothetical protein
LGLPLGRKETPVVTADANRIRRHIAWVMARARFRKRVREPFSV